MFARIVTSILLVIFPLLGVSQTKIDLARQVKGNLPVANLNSGTGATGSTFWQGDGTWSAVGLTTDVTGILPVANGGTGTSTAFTAGSVVFAGASGVYTQDNAQLFWDDSLNRLGIGTASPQTVLHVKGVARLESGTSGYIAFSPPTTGAAETYTWPAGPGTSDYVLTTNGTASTPTLSWTSKYWTRTLVSPGGSYQNFYALANGAPTSDVVRIGDQSESVVTPNGYTQLSVVSRWGRQAIYSFSAVSDMGNSYPAASGAMDTAGLYTIVLNDGSSGQNISAYGIYADTRAQSSGNPTWAVEATSQNISGTASVPIPSDAYSGGGVYSTAMFLQAAGTSTATTYDSSAALIIGANAPNGAKSGGYASYVSFNKGIVFLDYSIATLSSAMEAIAMSANHQVTWTALGGTSPKGRLYSDGTTLTWTSTGTAAISTTTVTATNLGGTLSTAAQGNVTSLGTLTGLNLSGAAVTDNAVPYATKDAGGTQRTLVYMDASSNAVLGPNMPTGKVVALGANSTDNNPIYIWVNGVNKNVTQDANDSCGAGYACLRVAN